MKKIWMFLLGAIGFTLIVGCGTDQDDCIAELLDDCPVTFNIDYVCGCDGVTYVNRSEAECYQIYMYTEGDCG